MPAMPKYIWKRGETYYVRLKEEDGRWRHHRAGPELGVALELRAALLNGAPDPDAILLADLVSRYADRLEVYYKPATRRTYATVSRHLLKYFRGRPVHTWTAQDIEGYVLYRSDAAKVAPSTINGELKALKATLRLAVDEGVFPSMPVKIRMLRTMKRTSSRLFTREEVQRLLDSADPRTRILMLICFATAFRIGEVRHLKWKDVDSASSCIRVTAKPGLWTPKTHHERVVYVSSAVIAQLAAYRATLAPFNGEDDWVLQSLRTPGQLWRESGSSFTPIQRAFKKAGLYSRGKLTHEIRRAVASTMLLEGAPIHVVKELLGHSSLQHTELYAFTDEASKRAVARHALV